MLASTPKTMPGHDSVSQARPPQRCGSCVQGMALTLEATRTPKTQLAAGLFLIHAEEKAEDNDGTAGQGARRGDLVQHHVGKHNVEDGGQRATDVVKGNADKLETKVVESNHGHKDDAER
jgi:hypothetical protein